ncbi:phospho-sugar mutase [Anaerobacillus alkaliphilus]|uniref:Phosphoglucomutase n=1 Tax=Anaerobacillus alkaliphilus TaxID=1548597 RepID=A0A4Q0VWJ7_9BACI|nr:phospho-sugar mutase [Anaerobacillus alkaliphilus]RXJ02575.1 phospho-sugar mutase [Anaerobacillus alkaliphilus]
MNWKEQYTRWCKEVHLDVELKEQIMLMENDLTHVEDCFYQYLQFGTGGMRGEIGPGPNRMNIYTVRRACQGLAEYIVETGEKEIDQGVVIAYDNRHKSKEFALEAAKTLGANGIKTYVFSDIRPTPELSFAVRHLHAFAGIVITASHNPPEYNGFKLYGYDGGQVTSEVAENITSKITKLQDELKLQVIEIKQLSEKGLLQFVDEEIDRVYLEQMEHIRVNKQLSQSSKDDLKIVYTPLHGTGAYLVQRGLKKHGFNNVTIVKEQENPDPSFSTVVSPNPEEKASFQLAIEYGHRLDGDILLATDPDGDRLGVAVKNLDGDYVVLTGNQLGALILDYILSQKESLPKDGVLLKTIVTSEMGRAIARKYGLETIDTLTGFKYIAEKIKEFESNKDHTFIFGYEESFGFLIGDFVRDKDAIQACLVAAEMAAYHKSKGKSLFEALIDLYCQVGYYQEDLASLTLKGKHGTEKIQHIMNEFRSKKLDSIANGSIEVIEDYQNGVRYFSVSQKEEKINLPASNVLKFHLEVGSWFCLRPSGTEPKLKIYFGVRGEDLKSSDIMLTRLKEAVMDNIEGFTKDE